MLEHYVVLRHRHHPSMHTLAGYQAAGGYRQWRRAVTELQPEEVLDVVKASGLRGRGGAGFPTGLKWSFCPRDVFPKYLVVNNDESEPGTFKDHEITLQNPHQLLEGAALACYAIGAHTAYIYCRGEFWQEMQVLEQALAEVRAAGLLGANLFGTAYHLDMHVAPGAGAYICGEETALLNSLEGLLGQPRLKPPFPAAEGLYGKPTVINNTETLANIPPILEHGAAWYRTLGTERSPGTKVFSVSGHVERPGNYELPLGTPFADLLALAGGVWQGRQLKAVMPAGASSMVIPAEVAWGLNLDWESVAAAGAQLGSASFIVLDETADMVWVADRTTRFFKHESCGKCSPCREGTYWMGKVYGRLRQGQGTVADIQLLEDLVRQIDSKCFCPLGEFALAAPRSTLEAFRGDYVRAVAQEDRPSSE